MIRRKSVLIFSIAVMFVLSCCNKQDNQERIITGIDIEELANRNLADFILLRESSKDSVRTEFVFVRHSDSSTIFLQIGIYQLLEDAESAATAYLNYISIYMNEGNHQGVKIGDQFWWWPSDADFNNITNIVFLRRNAFITISCSYGYDSLKALAKSIDDDIVNEETYVSFRN